MTVSTIAGQRLISTMLAVSIVHVPKQMIAITLAILWSAVAVQAQVKPELRYVAIVTRHGVRAPTAAVKDLAKYSAEPWPSWGVAPGELTQHGARLMDLFGAWYRQRFAELGLLSTKECADVSRVYFRADSDQRTRATAVALAAGMLPGCTVDPHALEEGVNDSLFDPLASGESHPDRAVGLASVLGRIGGR